MGGWGCGQKDDPEEVEEKFNGACWSNKVLDGSEEAKSEISVALGEDRQLAGSQDQGKVTL